MFLRKLSILAFAKSSSGRWGSKVTHSGAGGPWAETDPTGLCRDRSDLRELLVELGTPGQGAARVFAGRHCQGYAAGSLKCCTEVNLPSPPPITAPRHLSEDRARLESLSLMLTLLVMNRGLCCNPASASSGSKAGSHGSPPHAQTCGLGQKAEVGQAASVLRQHL